MVSAPVLWLVLEGAHPPEPRAQEPCPASLWLVDRCPGACRPHLQLRALLGGVWSNLAGLPLHSFSPPHFCPRPLCFYPFCARALECCRSSFSARLRAQP